MIGFQSDKNVQTLYDWYNSEIDCAEDNSLRIRKRINQLSLIFILAALINAFAEILRGESVLVFINVFISFLSWLLWYSIISSIVDRRLDFFERKVTDGKFKILDDDKGKQLKKVIFKIAEKMEIEQERIVIWLSTCTTYLPSIENRKLGIFNSYIHKEEKFTFNSVFPSLNWNTFQEIKEIQVPQHAFYKKDIHLIIPMNFFLLVSTFPKRAEALLAHEFGHVLQNDSELILWAEGFSSILYRAISGLLKINLLFFSISLIAVDYIEKEPKEFILSLINGAVFIGIFSYISSIHRLCAKMRLKSEELADTASILYSDGRALIESIEYYFEDTNSNRKANKILHPPINLRLKLIQQKINTFTKE